MRQFNNNSNAQPPSDHASGGASGAGCAGDEDVLCEPDSMPASDAATTVEDGDCDNLTKTQQPTRPTSDGASGGALDAEPARRQRKKKRQKQKQKERRDAIEARRKEEIAKIADFEPGPLPPPPDGYIRVNPRILVPRQPRAGETVDDTLFLWAQGKWTG